MTDIEALNRDDEESGPSIAFPPLYVLRAAEHCPECGEAMHVYTLGCAAFHDGEESCPVFDFHYLRRTRSVPDSVLLLLDSFCPGFRLDRDDQEDDRFLMNHCRCGAKLDDDFVAGDIGAAFIPDTPEGYRCLKLYRLPVGIAIPVESDYTIGGGEYLNIEDAEPL